MNKKLKLTKIKITNRLKKLINTVSNQKDIPYKLDSNMSHNKAESHYNKKGQIYEIDIGIQEIYNEPTTIFHPIDPPIDDHEIALAALNIGHETMHYIQCNHIFQKPILTENEQNQFIQHMAHMTDDEYYENSNYLSNANEIQAEAYGIQYAYDYLCEEFPNVSHNYHEQLVVSVVNHKMQNPNSRYFIHQDKPFTSLQEINQAFDKAYDDSFQTKRMYDINDYSQNNEIKIFMKEHPEAYDAYINAYMDNKPLEQDKCIACIGLLLYPELKYLYPAMQNIDLSYDTVILKKPKINIEQRITDANDLIKNINYPDETKYLSLY